MVQVAVVKEPTNQQDRGQPGPSTPSAAFQAIEAARVVEVETGAWQALKAASVTVAGLPGLLAVPPVTQSTETQPTVDLELSSVAKP